MHFHKGYTFERLIPLRLKTPHATVIPIFSRGKINSEDPQKIGEECKNTI